MKKDFVIVGFILITFLIALVMSNRFITKNQAQIKLMPETPVIIENSEEERIKATINSFWKYSKSDDKRLYNFLSDSPKNFFEKCRKPYEISSRVEKTSDDRDSLIPGRIPRLDDQIKFLSEDIKKDSVEITSFNSFRIQGNEAVAFIDYHLRSKVIVDDSKFSFDMAYKNIGLFLIKGNDNQWRIFTTIPKSVIDVVNNDSYNLYANKKVCKE